MELYSVVLSTTMLCLAMVFGSGGNITLLISMCAYKLLHKLQYILISMLLLTSLTLDLVWCPLEVCHLLQHYHSNMSANATFTLAGPSLYIFIITALTCIIVVICFQHVCTLTEKLNCVSRHMIAVVAVVMCITLVLGLAVGYGLLSSHNEEMTNESYQVLNKQSFIYRIVVFSFWILIGVLMFVVVMTFHSRSSVDTNNVDMASDYSEPPTPERLNMNIPTLLIKSIDEDGVSTDDPEAEAVPPTIMQGASSLKEDNMSTIGDLPTPSKSKSHHLGDNMAAILGRRRHTIGQIGPAGLVDVAQKAKTYNYVRKFSVDINALQAQLENPKIHGGKSPFLSDTELQKNTQNDNKLDLARRPHTPLLDMRRMEGQGQEGMSPPSPDDLQIATPGDNVNENASPNGENGHSVDRRNSSHGTMSPPFITLSQTTGDELHDNRPEKGTQFLKLSCLLLLTFIFCLLPMFVTEIVRDVLSQTAYVNILTCTMALSVVQTIIFPHVLFCMDNSIHTAVHTFFGKLHTRLVHICYGRLPVPTTEQDNHISVTQV